VVRTRNSTLIIFDHSVVLMSRPSIKNFTKSAPRSSRKAVVRRDPNALRVKDFSPEECSIAPQPTPVEYTIRLPKKIQVFAPITESGNISISPSLLMAGVPGGLTFWSRVRFERFSVYSGASGEDADLLRIVISPQSGWSQPPVSFTKSGTVGNVRAAIGFRLGLLDRGRFFETADVTELFVVQSAANSTAVLQASIELISPGP